MRNNSKLMFFKPIYVGLLLVVELLVSGNMSLAQSLVGTSSGLPMLSNVYSVQGDSEANTVSSDNKNIESINHKRSSKIETRITPPVSQEEYDALVDFYYSTGGDNWTNTTNPDFEEDAIPWSVELIPYRTNGTSNTANIGSPLYLVGSWYGIDVDPITGHVISLELPNNNLTGTIPLSISGLSYLKTLNLEGNLITSLPSFFSVNIPTLELFKLSGNPITTIPSSFCSSCPNLKNLYLDGMQLTSLPSNLGVGWNLLEFLKLGNNQITSIPSNFGTSWSNLKYFSFAKNNITSLPTDLGSAWINLRTLDLSRNFFKSFPANFGSSWTLLSDLYIIDVEEVVFPTNFGAAWINLISLNLSDGSSKTFPSDFGTKWTNLKHLYLDFYTPGLNFPINFGEKWINLETFYYRLTSYTNNNEVLPVGFGSKWSSLRAFNYHGALASIPSNFCQNCPSSSVIDISYNKFNFTTGLTYFPSLLQKFNTFIYSPQNLIDGERSTLGALCTPVKLLTYIDHGTTTPDCQYQWFRIDDEEHTPIQIEACPNCNLAIVHDLQQIDLDAQYYYQITNPALPLLTLVSHRQRITLGGSTDIFPEQVTIKDADYLCATKLTADVVLQPYCPYVHSYSWNFGDNTPVAYGKSVVHKYTNPGTYTVTLNIVYQCGSCEPYMSTHTQQINVDYANSASIEDVEITVPTDTRSSILSVSASEFSDTWTLHHPNTTLHAKNGFYNGRQGIWRNDATNVYEVNRSQSSIINLSNNGTFSVDFFNWQQAKLDAIPDWIRANTMTQYSPYSYELENKDVLGIYSGALYAYGGHLPVANGVNMRNDEMAFSGFEEPFDTTSGNWTVKAEPKPAQIRYTISGAKDNVVIANVPLAKLSGKTVVDVEGFQLNFFSGFSPMTRRYYQDVNILCTMQHSTDPEKSILVLDKVIFQDNWDGTLVFSNTATNALQATFSTVIAHTGKSSINVTTEQNFPQFQLNLDYGKSYIIDGWVSINNPNVTTPVLSTNLGILVTWRNVSSNQVISTQTIAPSGVIVEGWQRFKGTIVSPMDGARLEIKFLKGTTQAWYDDLRLYPENGNMKSYVYDKVDYRLRAILDEENYATLYYYDLEGNLYLVKKETVDGIKTLSESINYQTPGN